MEVTVNTTPYRANQTRKRAEKEQTIHRAENKKHYVKINKRVANDTRLSLEARGLMLYLLDKKDDWIVRPGDLRKHGLGSHRQRRVMSELAEAGYIVRDEMQTRSEKGRWGERLWRVRELPEIELKIERFEFSPLVGFPPADEPPAETPPAENSALINSESKLEMIHHDERDSFLKKLLGMFTGFENARDDLRCQLDRVGTATFEMIVNRCIKRNPKNARYFVTALEAELPHTPLPPYPQIAAETPTRLDVVTGLPELSPADFEPNMPLFRQLTEWDAERAFAAAEIAAGREYTYRARDTYVPTVTTVIPQLPESGLWQLAYMQIELQLDRNNFDTWVRGATLMRVEQGDVWVIGVRNSYARDYLQHRLYRNIRRVLSDVTGIKGLVIRFEIAPVVLGVRR